MNRVRNFALFVLLAMIISFANVSPATATSLNPLDDGGWELVAHMSNSGGMFDGNGDLMPGYAYGTYNLNPLASTPDFQRAFPVVADKILFITGDLSIWGIADYGDLRALIDERGSVFSPNLAFENGVVGVISNTTGNVLSRPNNIEDPWISMDGGHFDGITNQRIVWGENNCCGATHEALKNGHGGINVYIKAPTLQLSTDFDSGVPSEFSGITTAESVQGYAGYGTGSNVFGVDFLRNSNLPDGGTTLSLTDLPFHDSISLSYLLAIIDSWDGPDCAGDTFNVTVDGVSIFSEVFTNHPVCGLQTYIPPTGVELIRSAQLGFNFCGVDCLIYSDSAYNMGLDPTFQNIPHTSSSLTIEWFPGGGWQGGTDESWAIDNVQIFAHSVNTAPTAIAGGPYNGNEGAAIVLVADASDPDLDTLTYAWTVDSTSCSFDIASALNLNLTCSDNGSFTATLSVDDGVNPAVTSDASVTVSNVAPTLGAISVDQTLISVNTAINANASFTDPGTLDTHSATWDWGDGTSAGTVTQGAGSGSFDDSHSYSIPGVYTVKLIVTDNDLAGSNEEIYEFVVVYDPSGGFVTGGGWFDSPAGAYTADPLLTGRANFGFVAKYKKGANVPDGNTQFQFKAGDLNFHSSSYEWLVVAGNKAMFRGVGTINGEGSYTFLITADDDNPDTFRIHIWGDNGTVYDNGPNQALGGGSIKVHNGK